MATTIGGVNNSGITEPLPVGGSTGSSNLVSDQTTLPDVTLGFSQEMLQTILSNPQLAAPLLSCGLALETLINAIGNEERDTAVKGSKESLAAKAEQRKAVNDKQLQEIADRLEKMRANGILDIFKKIFKFIGMVVGAIAAAATIAVGVLTANPLLVAAGVMAAIMVVDSIVSEASDGKYSISAGVSALAQACGASEETAKWIGFGVSMGIMVVGIVLSFGAGLAANAGAMASKVPDLMMKVTQVVNIINGINMIGTGACQIADAALNYEISQSLARTKDLEAILERIKQATDTEENFLKFILEKFQDLLGKVKEIIEQSNEAQLAVATGGSETAPSLA